MYLKKYIYFILIIFYVSGKVCNTVCDWNYFVYCLIIVYIEEALFLQCFDDNMCRIFISH